MTAGRPPKAKADKQHHKVNVRFTRAEIEKVLDLAHARKQKLATLIREIVLNRVRNA